MDAEDARGIRAEVVLPCSELGPTLSFFTEELGFRIEAIFPADDPSAAVISGHGVRLRLQRGRLGSPGLLRLLCRDPAAVAGGALVLTAPNGTRIELAEAEPALVLPALEPSFVLSRVRDARWQAGRAGMLYRDLIPDRQGGRFIASHISIPDGGPVQDYVHFHRVRFQMIYCYKGWGRLVYEDQGAPFLMQAGGCVLQSPEIRHRVLESSPGFEVIEVSCPAEHETFADHELSLPTSTVRPERVFSGQCFVHHEAATAQWRPWALAGFESRDTGIAAASRGIADVRVVRSAGAQGRQAWSHDAELFFLFVLKGAITLEHLARESAVGGDWRAERVAAGDSFVLPAGTPHALAEASEDVELLQVALPGAFQMLRQLEAARTQKR